MFGRFYCILFGGRCKLRFGYRGIGVFFFGVLWGCGERFFRL